MFRLGRLPAPLGAALALAALTCALVLAGCAHKKPAVSTGPPPGTSTPSESVSTPPPPEPTEQPPAAEGEETSALKDVYFDYDSSELREDAKSTLSTNGAWLLSHASRNVQIEGHCDERGTVEYNLALGQRRAEGAKAFLESYGVGESRLSTISYGEERPADPGHDESAWAKNRRAHFVITR